MWSSFSVWISVCHTLPCAVASNLFFGTALSSNRQFRTCRTFSGRHVFWVRRNHDNSGYRFRRFAPTNGHHHAVTFHPLIRLERHTGGTLGVMFTTMCNDLLIGFDLRRTTLVVSPPVLEQAVPAAVVDGVTERAMDR